MHPSKERRFVATALAMISALLFLGACSTTTVSGSWKNPEYSGRIKTLYIVGVSKRETNRRIFEDGFVRQLSGYGIEGVSSYRDIPSVEGANKETIWQSAKERRVDAVLLTRIIDRRTEEVVTPGRITSYDTGPRYYGRGDYRPRPYYRRYDSYCDRCYETIYEPPTVSAYQVVTLESNIYDVVGGELIWSAQLEMLLEGNIEAQIDDFIKTVTMDLWKNGLI